MPAVIGRLFLHLSVSSLGAQMNMNYIHSHPALTTGLKSKLGLDFEVVVPDGDGSFPVVILLHGRGHATSVLVEKTLSQFQMVMQEVANTHIIVAPFGEHASWNIYGEPSKRDDTNLIGTKLTNYLAKFDNVQATFKLIGFSNGAGMANRILIENDNPQITTAVTFSSQLNQHQWHNGTFYIGGDDNAYGTPKRKLNGRRVLQVTTAHDEVIPAPGGFSARTRMVFLSWDESAYRLAEGFGYSGAQASFTQDGDTCARVSYLNGQVQAINYKKRLKGLESEQHLGYPAYADIVADQIEDFLHGS